MTSARQSTDRQIECIKAASESSAKCRPEGTLTHRQCQDVGTADADAAGEELREDWMLLCIALRSSSRQQSSILHHA